jgi:hypothetical protein
MSPSSATAAPGLESVIKSFYQIVDDVKRKPYDLLDYTRNQFDRDYLELNVNIHDLEIQLQVCSRWGIQVYSSWCRFACQGIMAAPLCSRVPCLMPGDTLHLFQVP